MDAPAEMQQRADLREYLAAERTLLAWIRRGLALMGFGFVVARFGLFLQQLQIGQHAPATEPYTLSQWFGTALIGASVVVNLLSGWHHVQLVRTISAGHEETRHSTTLAVSPSFFLALAVLAITIYLVSIRGAANRQSENTTRASMAQV